MPQRGTTVGKLPSGISNDRLGIKKRRPFGLLFLVPGTGALKAFSIIINCLWLCILWLFMYSNNTVKTGNIIEIWPNYGQGISVCFHCLLNRNAANKKGVRMHTFKTTHPQRHSPHCRRIRLTTTLHTCRTLSQSYVRSRSSFVGR